MHKIAADINLYLYVGMGHLRDVIADAVGAYGETYNEDLIDNIHNEVIMYGDVLEETIVQEGWADYAAVEFNDTYDIQGTIDYEGVDTPLDEGEIAEIGRITEDWVLPFVEEAVDAAESEDLIWIPVDSSNVESFAYDQDNRFLYVRFLPSGTGDFSQGSEYIYYDVEPEIYNMFLQAPSKGKFIWSHIRDRYEYERMR